MEPRKLTYVSLSPTGKVLSRGRVRKWRHLREAFDGIERVGRGGYALVKRGKVIQHARFDGEEWERYPLEMLRSAGLSLR